MTEAFHLIMENKNEMPRSVLLKKMAKLCNTTINSVRCSTFDTTHWFSEEWFNKKFGCYNHPKKRKVIVKKDYANLKGIDILDDLVDYNTEEKNTVRTLAFDGIESIHYPKVLTFANRNGYCVNHVKGLNPNAIITNVEQKKDVLNEYKKKCPFNDINHYYGTINSYLKTQVGNCFDAMFYDCHSYISKTMYEDLLLINTNKMCKTITITLRGIKQIRNHGPWTAEMKKRYQHIPDQQQLVLMMDSLSNYAIDDQLVYSGSGQRNQSMVIYKFKLIN